MGDREEIVAAAIQPKVSNEENQTLIVEPSLGEIRQAAFSINADKARSRMASQQSYFNQTGLLLDQQYVRKSVSFSDLEYCQEV